MISKHKLFKHPDYLLSKYKAEVYRQLQQYMDDHGLTQKEIANHLGVSGSYVNQVLKGNFNFTLKKLIELSLMMGKVPMLEFVNINDYLVSEGKQNSRRAALGDSTPDKVPATRMKSKRSGKASAVKSARRT